MITLAAPRKFSSEGLTSISQHQRCDAPPSRLMRLTQAPYSGTLMTE